MIKDLSNFLSMCRLSIIKTKIYRIRDSEHSFWFHSLAVLCTAYE